MSLYHTKGKVLYIATYRSPTFDHNKTSEVYYIYTLHRHVSHTRHTGVAESHATPTNFFINFHIHTLLTYTSIKRR